MKAIPTKKKKAAIIVRRKPFDKVDEQTKIKIVEEIKTGMISCLGASRKYRVPRNTIKAWAGKLNLTTLLNANNTSALPGMTQSQESKLLVNKIRELTKALELSQLKNLALETMIEVAESDLHIKIRKKRGTKQS
jgi:transposase